MIKVKISGRGKEYDFGLYPRCTICLVNFPIWEPMDWESSWIRNFNYRDAYDILIAIVGCLFQAESFVQSYEHDMNY